MVETSSSPAPLQIGRLYERQNLRLQSAQVPWPCVGCVVLGDDAALRPSSWIIVLLLKQVHLQKDVAAEVRAALSVMGGVGGGSEERLTGSKC